MDNSNLNPSVSEMPSAQNTDMKFPTYESMKKISKKSPHFLIAIIVIIVVGMSLLWYYFRSEFEFIPTQLKLPSENRKTSDKEMNEINSINVNDLDSEFQSIDADLNSL